MANILFFDCRQNVKKPVVVMVFFLFRGHQSELRERMETLRTMGGAVVGRSPTSNMNSKTNSNPNCQAEESVLLSVPQVFVEGQYLGVSGQEVTIFK